MNVESKHAVVIMMWESVLHAAASQSLQIDPAGKNQSLILCKLI